MIQSETKPNNVPVPPKQSVDSTSNKGTVFNAAAHEKPPQKKGPMIVLLAVLFIAAVGGGLLAYRNFSQTNTVDLTQKDNLLAWRPYSVRGTCSGIKVIGEIEQVPYSFRFTFVLSEGSRTGTLVHTFDSKPVSNGHKIDEDISWSSLGAQGAQFGGLLKTNDTVNWSVEVSYVLNGQNKTENYADSFKIFDASCSTVQSPSPSVSASATASSRPSASVSASPTASPSQTASASPTPTASPSDPPVGGPSDTPTPSPSPTTPPPTSTPAPTNTPAPSSTTTTQATNPPTEVAAKTQTEELPKAGVPYGLLFMGFGFVSLAVSAGLTLSKKRF